MLQMSCQSYKCHTSKSCQWLQPLLLLAMLVLMLMMWYLEHCHDANAVVPDMKNTSCQSSTWVSYQNQINVYQLDNCFGFRSYWQWYWHCCSNNAMLPNVILLDITETSCQLFIQVTSKFDRKLSTDSQSCFRQCQQWCFTLSMMPYHQCCGAESDRDIMQVF